ncbi:hypothetical protein V2J09_015333 [Rumex salicifolius]
MDPQGFQLSTSDFSASSLRICFWLATVVVGNGLATWILGNEEEFPGFTKSGVFYDYCAETTPAKLASSGGSMNMSMSFSQDIDDEYEKLIRRMNPPRVVIDNETCKNATVIQVDSANRHGILLEVVQILTDLNLTIRKAYISSDGGWFMDVFNATDQEGNKITDEEVIDYIHKSLGPDSSSMDRSVGFQSTSADYTSIELIGRDRPGLLSELSAVLAHLGCNVVNAEVWTHNTRAAAVMHITDQGTGSAIDDQCKLARIKELLCNVLRGSNQSRKAKTVVSCSGTHKERRLHQMMFDDEDHEAVDDEEEDLDAVQRPIVNVDNWCDKDYSVVTVRSKDRPKLLFDTVCTLTDMQYVVFHGSVDAEGSEAIQEYYIRDVDGSPVKTDEERQRVIHCLEAAIMRRVSEGLKLELCTTDRVGLLSDVTRIFREYGLSVTRAEVATKDSKAANIFYVSDASGYAVDAKTIESIRQVIGQPILKVKGTQEEEKQSPQESQSRFLFGGLFKSRSFVNLACEATKQAT